MDLWWIPALVALASGVGAGTWWMRARHQRAQPVAVGVSSREVLGALSFPAMITTADGNVVQANAAARLTSLVTPVGSVPHSVKAIVTAAAAVGEARDHTVEVRQGLHDRPVEMVMTASPMTGSLVLVVAHDANSALAAEVARREVAVNISHELKTPIGALSLLIEALQAAAGDPERVRDFTTRMSQEVARLHALVQQSLDLARVQASETVVEPTNVDLTELVDSTITDLRTLAETRGVTVVTDLEPCSSRGDAELLTMALRNVVENGIQYSQPDGRVIISTSIDGDVCSIAVMDHGIGIADDDLPRVFERFFRADAARSRERGGTGLGLSIVKHVMRQHGGDVHVWSASGVGTTVTLRLPVVREGS